MKSDSESQQRRELVLRKIEVWKKYLLDLTRRNRLLFFTTSRTNMVQVTLPAPEELFEQLVINGRKLTFPIPKRERQLVLEITDQAGSEAVSQDDFKAGDLETSSPVRELQNKLYRLKRDWRTWQEEQGLHTLFLVLGMLHWREAEYEQEKCLAPLILVPVGLEEDSTEKPYSIEPVEFLHRMIHRSRTPVEEHRLLPGTSLWHPKILAPLVSLFINTTSLREENLLNGFMKQKGRYTVSSSFLRIFCR